MEMGVCDSIILWINHYYPIVTDIGLFSVGITNLIDDEFLAAISGDIGVTNGNQVLGYDYFKAPDFQALDSMLDIVTTGICENPKPSKYFKSCIFHDLMMVQPRNKLYLYFYNYRVRRLWLDRSLYCDWFFWKYQRQQSARWFIW